MGSLQNLFLSSAAMTFTWGIWEIQLRHLAFTPHHNRVLLWVCAPGPASSPLGTSLAPGTSPGPYIVGVRSHALNVVLLARPSALGEPWAFMSSLLFPSWCHSFPESLFEPAPGPPSKHPCLHTSSCRLLLETSWTPGRMRCPCSAACVLACLPVLASLPRFSF